MIGLRVGIRCGARVGLRVGTESGGVAITWTVDATSGIGTPMDGPEASDLIAGTGATPNITNHWNHSLVVSGDVPDTVGGKTLAATASGGNAWAYEQSESGWALKFMTCADGGAAKLLNSSMPNPNATSYSVFALMKVAASADGNRRAMFSVGTPFEEDASVNIANAPVLSIGEGDGTYVNGVADPVGVVRWYGLLIDSAGTVLEVYTSQEKIVSPSASVAGTAFRMGGDFSDSWRPPAMSIGMGFVHQGALTRAQFKAALTLLNENPVWSP